MPPKKATASASGGGDSKEKKGGTSVKVIILFQFQTFIHFCLFFRLGIYYARNKANVSRH